MTFDSPTRSLEFIGPTGTEMLELVELSGTESLSNLFHFMLQLAVKPAPAAGVFPTATTTGGLAAKLVLKDVRFKLRLADGTWRTWSGIAKSLQRVVEPTANGVRYEVEVVPRLWKLTRRSDCRPFLDSTAPGIFAAILDEHGLKDDVVSNLGTYTKRESRTQYCETDFEYFSRILEEEGIFYWFGEDGKLVLGDTVDSFGSPVGPVVAVEPNDVNAYGQSITRWQQKYQVAPERYTGADFNQAIPLKPIIASQPGTKNGLPALGHKYEYPGGFRDDAEAGRSTRLKMELEEISQLSSECSGTVRWFSPGKVFRVDEANVPQRITWVSHRAWDYEDSRGYKNQFGCIPAEVVFRPPTTVTKPKMAGPQTATVVGPNGADVGAGGLPFHTDAAGRARLRFPWDRHRGTDREASAWIPVKRRWGGAGYGEVQIYRIGQQVVVEYLDGDIDRPIITGVIYNEAADLPADPVAHPERSCWKSQSVSGGADAGGHLIRLDDAANAEMIVVSSQRDLFINALKDLCRACDGNARERVGGNWNVSAEKGAFINGGPLVRMDGDKMILNTKEFLVKTEGGFIHLGPAGITIKGNIVKVNCAGAEPTIDALEPASTIEELRARFQ